MNGGTKIEYDRGNYDKYRSSNPLKRFMVCRLNKNIIGTLKRATKQRNRTYRILDAGCGEGFISRLIFDHVGNAQITGLEYVPEALEMAKSLNDNDKICFLQGDICAMLFADSSFDIAVCTEVLEHLENPDAALRELLRVSGRFILLTVPNEPWFCLGNLLAFKNVKRLGNPPSHINHWTFHGFVRLVESLIDPKTCEMKSWRSFPWTVVLLKKKKSFPYDRF